ncbi:MAG: Lrp/AsnC family transcriptional regulator [Thermoprotei archaeon]|nr:MAG: Lrp/AsnC family transcriptional regulator [Thermoprotei archaeon]
MAKAKAIVLIQTDIGSESSVMEKLFELPEVRDVYIVYGIYDIVTLIEADSLEKIREIIIHNIRRIPGVRTTTTMVVVEGKSKRE